MENSFEVIELQVKELERELAYWREVLQKSEKYERLMADPDFLEVLEDMNETVRAHEKEIKTCLDGMSEYSPKMLGDAQHTLFIHQILLEQSKLAIERPRKILELAKESRKKVPDLEQQISRLKVEVQNA